jgi:hypothetical protein
MTSPSALRFVTNRRGGDSYAAIGLSHPAPLPAASLGVRFVHLGDRMCTIGLDGSRTVVF